MRVFVTGATGFVGGPVLALLLAHGHDVRALVRADGGDASESAEAGSDDAPRRANDAREARAYARLRADLAPFSLPDEALARLSIREGDLASLDTARSGGDAFFEPGGWVFLHLAAALKADSDMGALLRTNVDGTSGALVFARQARARLFAHVSTAYVCGRPDVPFDARSPAAVTPDSKPFATTNNAYEASKRKAEEVVLEAGLRTLVLRPSIVVPRPGSFALHRKGASFGPLAWAALISRLARGVAMMRTAGFADCGLNCVDVDDVARGIVGALEDAAEGVGEAHLRSLGKRPILLCAKEETPVATFLEAMRRASGIGNLELLGTSHLPDGQHTPREAFYNQVAAFFTGYVTQAVRFEDPWFHGSEVAERWGVQARGFSVDEVASLVSASCVPRRERGKAKARACGGESSRIG